MKKDECLAATSLMQYEQYGWDGRIDDEAAAVRQLEAEG